MDICSLAEHIPTSRVFQVHVLPESRSTGVARRLIGALRKYGEDTSWLTIRARVASELEANKFWQGMGFRIVRQLSSTTHRTINLYEIELDVPSLFGRRQFPRTSSGDDSSQIAYARPLLPTPSYVIDLNVFFDAVRQRDKGESAFILSTALSGEIRVLVTPEFRKELGTPLTSCIRRSCSGICQDPADLARNITKNIGASD